MIQKFRRAELRFVGQDRGKKFAGVVVDGDEKIFARISFDLIFEQWEPFRVEVNQFAGVFFLVSARPFFQFFLELFFDSRESFATEFETTKSFIHARSWLKFLQSSALEDFINRWSTDAISLRELGGSEIIFGVIAPDFSPLDGSESGVLVEIHIYRLMDCDL